jgi:rubrerythrin
MSLFEEVGRTFERAKQSFTGDDDYRCGECDATFDAAHDHCPDCGAAAVEPVDGE